MELQQIYEAWKPSTGTVLGDGQCVSEIVNNSRAYIEALWPGVSWTQLIASVNGANQLMTAFNPAYFDVVVNDHNNPNQLPPVGAIMVFDHTPATFPDGHETTNKFVNPYGHDGIADGNISNSGFDLAQQNAPSTGQGFNVTHYDWNYRLCMGWAIPKVGTTPAPIPAPAPAPGTGHTVYLPPTTGPWHLYPEGGPYTYAAAGNHILYPSVFGGLTYDILEDRGGGIYTIQTEDFGRGDIYTRGSDVVVK